MGANIAIWNESLLTIRVSTELKLKFQPKFQKKVIFFQPFGQKKHIVFQPYHEF